MNLNIFQTLQKLYPQVITLRGDVAYDANENEVTFDLQAVTTQAQADAQAKLTDKESALSKLTALGLTANEVKALLGAT
jgi:hypothetical protein